MSNRKIADMPNLSSAPLARMDARIKSIIEAGKILAEKGVTT